MTRHILYERFKSLLFFKSKKAIHCKIVDTIAKFHQRVNKEPHATSTNTAECAVSTTTIAHKDCENRHTAQGLPHVLHVDQLLRAATHNASSQLHQIRGHRHQIRDDCLQQQLIQRPGRGCSQQQRKQLSKAGIVLPRKLIHEKNLKLTRQDTT